jgi:hypothetical protein
MKVKAEKKFDCVKSVRTERERITSELEGKSAGEIIDYFREKRRKSGLLQKKR